MGDQMVVKVQVPLYSVDPDGAKALIYNEDRSVEVMCPITEDILESMDGKLKRFFFAHMEGTILHLDGFAPWQEW